jgi:hypothetical protein
MLNALDFDNSSVNAGVGHVVLVWEFLRSIVLVPAKNLAIAYNL